MELSDFPSQHLVRGNVAQNTSLFKPYINIELIVISVPQTVQTLRYTSQDGALYTEERFGPNLEMNFIFLIL